MFEMFNYFSDLSASTATQTQVFTHRIFRGRAHVASEGIKSHWMMTVSSQSIQPFLILFSSFSFHSYFYNQSLTNGYQNTKMGLTQIFLTFIEFKRFPPNF